MRRYLMLGVKGMAMGAGDVVPGVSGGTIAFITGIYEELIDSIRSIDHTALKVLLKQGPVKAWQHINGNFLLAVFGGILLSIASLAHLIEYALETYPVLIWAFFFGLVCASIIYIGRQIGHWKVAEMTALVVGTLIALGIGFLKPAQLPSDLWVVFLAGSVAICAMILPGISGAFILVLLGVYPTILGAISNLDFKLLLTFAMGCGVGLLAFSHVLSWLLHHYRTVTLAALTGFLLGSLNLLWPWKQTVETYLDRHGELVPLVQKNISATQYAELFGRDSQWLSAIIAMVLGVMLVLGLEHLAGKNDS